MRIAYKLISFRVEYFTSIVHLAASLAAALLHLLPSRSSSWNLALYT